MPEPDVTENYIRMRVKNPEGFQENSFRTIDISKEKGIKAIIGKLKGESTTTVQSYLFDKDKWTVERAEAWVDKHKENLSKRITKVIMTAPDTYIKQFDNGDGTYTQESYQRSTEGLLKIFEGTVARLQLGDGAQFPVPIIEEHTPEGRPLGAVEQVALVEVGKGKLGMEATLLVEDEELARRLTEGTLWTSPGVIYGGMLGVEDRTGDYIEELSVVGAPAQRDYKARELLSARENRLAPERANSEGGEKMPETVVTGTATVEQLSKRLVEVTVENEKLTKALDAEKKSHGETKTELEKLQAKVRRVELEQLSKDLAEKGLNAGEIEGVLAQVKKHPEDQEEIVATAEKMAARIPPEEEAPKTSPASGKAPKSAKDQKKNVENLVVGFVQDKGGEK